MKTRYLLAAVSGTVMLLSGVTHALFPWPHYAAHLRDAGVDSHVTDALAVGWYFGSVAMLVFAALAGYYAWELRRGRLTALVPLQIVGAGYVGFGVAAFLVRDLNPHLLGFVLAGLLLLAAGWPGRSRAEEQGAEVR